MVRLIDWSTVRDASPNTDPSPTGAPEGMGPAGLNDTHRESRAVIRRWLNDNSGLLQMNESATNVYTLSPQETISAYEQGLTYVVSHTGAANTGSCTINVDAVGAATVYTPDGSALVGGEFQNGGVYMVVYDTTVAGFQLISSSVAGQSSSAAPPRSVSTTHTVEAADLQSGGLALSTANPTVLTLPAVHTFWPVGGILRIFGGGRRDLDLEITTSGDTVYRSFNSTVVVGPALGSSAVEVFVGGSGLVTSPDFAEIIKLSSTEFFIWR